VLRNALLVIVRYATDYFYRPEKHYMRGPGPKSLGMLGKRLRGGLAGMAQMPMPARWLLYLAARSPHRPEAVRSKKKAM
jgi:hypothetical protein